jgi:APA family basic amino acid/polyamine antiporter
MFWSMHSGIIAALAMIVARYFSYMVPLNDAGIKVVAITTIVVLSGINYVGVKQGSRVQTLFTLAKLIAIALIVVLGFVLGSKLPDHFVAGAGLKESASLRDFLLALVAGLFAYGGWHMVTYSSGESVDAQRNIPKALVIGTLIVTVCYIALNAVYMFILPLGAVASSTRVAADAADALLGFGGGAFMSVLVILSTFGSLSGIILSGPRVYYSMACDGLLFRWAGRVHPRFQTPHNAIVMQAIWSSVLICTGTYRALFTRVVYTEWIFFGLMTLGIFILRRRRVEGIYRMWGYPTVPAIFVLSSFGIVANQMLSDPLESITGLALVFAGLPVYYLWARREDSCR